MKRRTLRAYAFVFALAFVLTACSRNENARWQGYAEGEYVYLASSQSGTLTDLAVKRGQTVAANVPVFALEAVEETAARDEAQHRVTAAQQQLADLKTGKRPPEVRVTEAQLAQAEANARKASLQLTRDEAQLRAGGIAQAQLDDSRAQAASTAAQVRELQNQVRVANLPGRTAQIAAQAAEAEAARASLAQAQWRLDQKRVSAPSGGLVYDTLFRVGEWVQAGSPVVQMLPPQNVKVRFFVPETIVGSLAPGRKVNVRCDGCAADVPATITWISNAAEYTPPVIYSNENRAKLIFMIEARPSEQDAVKLHPGQPVEVTLQ
ncbi:Predicted membrane fusion protein (MFP) component of efflux pump, membrane anchor protein YbhG [Paraburkholderia unamae]|uniref:HlyD family secretion protein n=1 Tax=Paraburkholderia unamae TaxID=219649 RepID=UPI001CB3FD1C|nr:HlyD family efflux transporter periplasmic adaptor subunit [Paraburkholderia unamae]CAG9275121.1 Predicted membrane fusion protein (MFP) component of efflux pump, membrane anchor protein YbhG [Paraburkholderia unamae]